MKFQLLFICGMYFLKNKVSKYLSFIPCFVLRNNAETVYEFFTNFWQYKNVNITNLVFALPLERNKTNGVCNLEI